MVLRAKSIGKRIRKREKLHNRLAFSTKIWYGIDIREFA